MYLRQNIRQIIDWLHRLDGVRVQSIVAVWFLACFAPLVCILHCHLLFQQASGETRAAFFICQFLTIDAAEGTASTSSSRLAPLPRITYKLSLPSGIVVLICAAFGLVPIATGGSFEEDLTTLFVCELDKACLATEEWRAWNTDDRVDLAFDLEDSMQLPY